MKIEERWESKDNNTQESKSQFSTFEPTTFLLGGRSCHFTSIADQQVFITIEGFDA